MSFVSVWALSANKSRWRSIRLAAADRISAGVLAAALSPILLAMWVAIFVLSERSPLIAQKRDAPDGSEQWVLKFDTLWNWNRSRLNDVISVEYIDDEIGPSRNRQDLRRNLPELLTGERAC